MLNLMLGSSLTAKHVLEFLCLVFSFALTFVLLKYLQGALPTDGGRAFAVNGEKSKGKPRGAGIIFVLVHILMVLVFLKIDREIIIYMVMLMLGMLTGYFDDAAEKPWGELKKGILDFIIALVIGITYVYFNGSKIYIALLGLSVTIPPVLFVILAIILVWAAINVVNCTDGVDGLSGTLAIVTLLAFLVFISKTGHGQMYGGIILSFIMCLVAYLWFNASPSKLLMGDAGSRAIGLFIAIISLKSGSPLLFIPLAIVFILDGGLGLVKLTMMRVFKIGFMKNIRLPLHDHARKKIGWSDTQTVFRFVIIATVICVLYLAAVLNINY